MPAFSTSFLVANQAALVSALNTAPSGTWNVPFTAAAVYVPILDVAAGEVTDLQVLVCPNPVARADGSGGGNGKSLDARRYILHHTWLDIGVAQLVASPSDARIGDLMLLVDLIYDYLVTQELSTGFKIVGAANEPPYSADHLTQRSTFLSVISMHLGYARQLGAA